MTTQSGSIDGIAYASSKDVYDSLGYGVVTQILYYDQSGAEVADRHLFFDLNSSIPVGIGPKNVNPDGSFSFNLYPGGGSGIPQGYSAYSFSGDGIETRQDNYTPIYITTPDLRFLGTDGYTDSYTLVKASGPGSSGTINGAYYDEVQTQYDSSGHAVEADYMNDLNNTQTRVGRVILATPDPVFTAPAAATASAGSAQPLTGISLADDWAGVNPGTLALVIKVDSGTVSGYDGNGNPYTVTAGQAEHLSGTLTAINAELLQLSFTGQSAGTAHLSLEIYDQAGAWTVAHETITVGAAAAGAATPDPILTGVTQTTATTGTPLSLNGVTFSDAWAAAHAGTLSFTATTNFGSLSDVYNSAAGSGASVHATGTVAQIDNDLAGLVLASGQAGTATVRVAVYDQAGLEATHLIGVTFHASV